MSKSLRHVVLLIGVLALGLSGCLRQASDGQVVGVQGQALNSPTPQPSPFPTQEPIVITEEVIITATPDPFSQEVFPGTGGASDGTNNDLNAQDVPAAEQDQGLLQNTESAPVEPRFQTATAIIEQATLNVIYMTQTAEGPVQPLATNTPAANPFATNTPGAAPISGQDCVHEVVAGENMFRLSMRYGVSINDIAVRSGITNPNLISVGQKLVIPGCGTTGVFPPPTSFPTTGDGTGGTGTGGTGTGGTGSGGGRIHVVQQYESLFEISLTYNVPVNTIAAANGISNVNLIYIGQELVIP